ncbi:uncharacterized protein LOC133312828 [Gastrolobium bilobum]|uniref:uncharacterized protein LOC133312828 n=1 Tax=Gastrolobium bilobum TaxID=150636 RepID=UPI002AB1C83A|nr:uncharacterized protein LOC133312828 [Gastrolobium bilobum]
MAMVSSDNTNVVFIDTSLDTHLAVIVFDHDTVSDLKKRILSEHPLCFPKIGQIQIHGIKVKRKGYYYHLSDSMFVRSAFNGFNKSWFLNVDASALGECGQNEQLFASGSPNQLACLDIANNALIDPVDNAVILPSKRVSGLDNSPLLQLENKQNQNEEIPIISPCISEHTGKEAVESLEIGVKSSGNNDTGIPLTGSVPETLDHCYVNHELPSLNIEREVDGSGKGTTDDCNVCKEDPSIAEPSAKKKRKSKRQKEDSMRDDNSKDNIASVDKPLSFPSKRTSSLSNFPMPQLDNKQDEKAEIPFVSPLFSEYTGKVVKNLEMNVKSSCNNDLPNSHVECEVDGSNKGIKDDCISKSVPSAKKKQKSKRKKEDTVQDDTLKENDPSVVEPANYKVQQDIVVLANPSVNADKEVIKETEVLKEHQHTECSNNNYKNDIDAVSIKEASDPGPAANKKPRKRKRSLTRDSKEMSKVETASQTDEAQKSDETRKERKETKDQFELNDKSRDDVEYKHNKVTEDVSDTRPPAKKKPKRKEKSLSKEKLISDFNIDNASSHFLEDQQKIKHSSADQSAQHINDSDPLRTSVLGGRSKRKTNSSNPHETPVVTSFRKDGEADRFNIQGGVQEETSEDGLFSKDAGNEGIVGTGTYMNHSVTEIKAHPSDVNESQELTEDNANVVLDHCHKSQATQTGGAEEGREVSSQSDPKLMLLEMCTPSNQDNRDTNVRELNVTSKVVDVNDLVKSEKKKKKGIRRAKDSGGGPALTEGISLVDASESETVNVKSVKATDPMSGNTETEENPLNQAEGKKIRQEEMKGTVLSATDMEDDFSTDNTGSLEKIKTKSNAEHVDEHADKIQRKKSNNKQTSTSESISNMLIKDKGLDSKKPSPSSDSGIHANPSFKMAKKSKSANTKSTNKSSKTNLEPVKDSVGLESSDMLVDKMNEADRTGVEKMVQNKAGKASGNDVWRVVSRKQQKRSLLAGEIFKDDSSGTSEDEGEVDNSDASTRIPLDNSVLSDFSDGDSSAGFNSGKRLENGRSSIEASLSGTKGISVDRILRSSSRFKKAKISASQLEETERQPEFVPDSLADM